MGSCEGKNVHYLIDLFDGQRAVDFFHGFAGIVHGEEGFLVDVRGFDRIDLVLEHGDLGGGLFKGVLVSLFALQCCPGSCSIPKYRLANHPNYSSTISLP